MISIIIPTYNRATFLARAVKSIINQTYQDVEIIIIDDGSQDDTDIVVEQLIEKFSKFKIQYLKNEKNRGAQHSRNKGINNAKGEWIAFLDSDDEWLPKKLEKCIDLAKKENLSVVHSEGYIDYNDGSPLVKRNVRKLKGFIYSDILKNAGPMFPSLLVRKKCFEKIGYLDESIVAHQEWETSIRLAKYYDFGFINEPLFIWHQDGHDSISTNEFKNCLGYQQIIEKHKVEITKERGEKALENHYKKLAYRFYAISDLRNASRFFLDARKLSKSFYNRFIYLIQSNEILMRYINPKLFDYYLIEKRINVIKTIK